MGGYHLVISSISSSSRTVYTEQVACEMDTLNSQDGSRFQAGAHSDELFSLQISFIGDRKNVAVLAEH